MKSKSIPTPPLWQVEKRVGLFGSRVVIVSAMGEEVATLTTTYGEAEANAALIVQAVNFYAMRGVGHE